MKKNVLFIAFIVLIVVIIGVTGVSYLKSRRPKPKEIKITKIEKRKIVKAEAKARVALVIDDVGYSLKNLNEIFELEIPITLSILPHLRYSKKIAETAMADGKNCQIILHLPLEPCEENKLLEKTTIFCNMKPQEVLQTLDEAIANVPNLMGVSNHMGSRATSDKKLMTVIFKKMKKHKLFFMDNVVTPNSVCEKVAKRVGIKFVKRSVFLDNEPDLDYIKNQIRKLCDEAFRTGWAVGVGHDRPKTILAIRQMMPELKKEKAGIEFVFLSDLAKTK